MMWLDCHCTELHVLDCLALHGVLFLLHCMAFGVLLVLYCFYCIALFCMCNNLCSLFLSNGGVQNMGEHCLSYEICEYMFPCHIYTVNDCPVLFESLSSVKM